MEDVKQTSASGIGNGDRRRCNALFSKRKRIKLLPKSGNIIRRFTTRKLKSFIHVSKNDSVHTD